MIMLKLVCLLSSWITVLVSTSLPHLYFKLGRARGVEVRDFRRLEKAGRNLSKVILDHHYFEKCEELGVCPQFLKFKPPNLRAYKDVKQFYQRAVKKQLGVIGREIKRNKAIYLQCWEKIRKKLGFFERLTLISKLNGYYKSEAEKCILHTSSALDPRFKGLPFLAEGYRLDVYTRVISEAASLEEVCYAVL